MIYRNPLLWAISINILFFLLYLAFGQIRQGSLDDYFMSSVLTGAYGGDYDVHMYFIHALYGYFLRPFYWLFPQVGWYFIFELLGSFAAFTTITYLSIHKLGCKWGIVVSSVILASLTPDFYFQISFTQCATLYTAAGILCFVFGASEKNIKYLLLGGLFLITGDVMRHEGFLLGLPYLLLLLGNLFLLEKKWWKVSVISLCAIMVLIGCLRAYDKTLYSEGDYKYYADYQPVRAYFGDGAFYDKEATFDELEERGMSGLDFYFLKAWIFYDTEVFCIDSLNKFKNIAQNNLYTPNPKRMVVTFFLSVSNAFTRTNGWCWFILCIPLLIGRSRMANIYPWLSIGIVAVSIGYLLLVNRLVYHVESGVWLYAIVSTIPFLSSTDIERTQFVKNKQKICVVALLFLSGIFIATGISNQSFLKTRFHLIETPEMPAEWKDFVRYAHEHPDDVFLLSFERYKSLGTFRNPAYRAIEPGSWNNIFSWGYWNIHLPSMKEELFKRGVTNPLRDITHDNVYLIEDNDAPSLGEFYERHYHRTLVGDTVRSFGDLILLKYRLKDSAGVVFYE